MRKLPLAIVFILLCRTFAMAQGCSSATGANYKGVLSPTTSFQSISGVNAGDYWTFTASPCSTLVFSFCPTDGGSASWNTEMTIDDNTGAANTGGYNNNSSCGNPAYLSWTPASAGTYRIFVTKYNCLTSSSSSGVFVYRVDVSNTVTSEYSLVGSASTVSGCVTLTAANSNETGCAWDVNSNFDFTSSFTYDYTINLGSNDAGADGLAFVIQNDPKGLCACGTAGGGMGAEGISNSIIIEIDTYLNYEDRDDGISGVSCSGGPDPDHIDLWLNGNVNPSGVCGSSPGARIIPAAIPLMFNSAFYNIENGADHKLRIGWAPGGATGTLTATIMDAGGTISYGTLSYVFNPITVFGTNFPYFGFTASTGALSNQQGACLPQTLLPVQLVYLKAKCNNANVVLQWQTASEWNSNHFSIERSPDAVDFMEVATVRSAGTSADPHSYEWTDPKPLTGTAYYRLAEVAEDGNKTYSGVVSTDCSHAEPTTLNAFLDESGQIVFSMNGNMPGEGVVSLIDLNGRTLISKPVSTLTSTGDHFEIGTGKLPAGTYLVTLRCDDHFYSSKVISF